MMGGWTDKQTDSHIDGQTDRCTHDDNAPCPRSKIITKLLIIEW